MKKITDELTTIRDFIRYGVSRFNKAGISDSRNLENIFDETLFLVFETLGLPVDDMDVYLDARLTEEERAEVTDIIDKRIKTRKPTAYLTKRAHVGDFSFYVDEHVAVPRSFLAELLYSELVSDEDRVLIDDTSQISTVLDLCTGSGCLAVIAAHLFPEAEVDAVDVSLEALAIAKTNVEESYLKSRITLIEGDLFTPVRGRRYDLIIANPPSIPNSAMESLPPEYRHEPKEALAGGEDGLDFVRKILKEAPDYLSENGAILCEVSVGREKLEAEYPHIEFTWIDSDDSDNQIFWLTYDELIF